MEEIWSKGPWRWWIRYNDILIFRFSISNVALLASTKSKTGLFCLISDIALPAIKSIKYAFIWSLSCCVFSLVELKLSAKWLAKSFLRSGLWSSEKSLLVLVVYNTSIITYILLFILVYGVLICVSEPGRNFEPPRGFWLESFFPSDVCIIKQAADKTPGEAIGWI